MNLSILLRQPDDKALRRDGAVQIDVCGSVRIGPAAEALANTFEVIVGRYPHVVVNLAGVDRLDARGVGCLVQAYTYGLARGTLVSLSNLPPAICEMVLMVKLLVVFCEHDDLPLAA